ncbi:MAG: oligosaccharide flippase family protein [Candidatus Cloacimonetes bacterium]|nr:oligosaccharide flippase family protein [Candidatus Cloacimonadota bacterium]
MQRLYRNTFVYFVGNIMTRFVGFFLLPLYTNVLSTDEFGSYTLLMAIYAILNVLYQAGIFQGFTKFFYDEQADTKRVFSTTLNTIILFGFFIAVLLSLLNKPLISLFQINQELSSFILILFWLIFFDTLAYFGLHFLRTRQFARIAVTYSLITSVCNLLLNVIFLVLWDLNILGILLAQGIANLLLLFLCLRHFKGLYQALIDWILLKRLMLFSLPLVIAGAFGIMMDVADRFIINFFLDRSHLGVYGVAYKLGLLMNVFVIAFRTAYLPYFLNMNKTENYNRELKQTLIKLVGLMSILFLAVTLFLRYLFHIEFNGFFLLNPDYISAAAIVPFILLAYVFNGFAAFFSLGPYVSGKSYHFIISDAIGFSVNIVLNLLIIPIYGIMGAALATLVGFYTAALYMYFVFTKEMKENLFGKENLLIIIGCLISLYAASLGDLFFVRLLLLILFIIYCLRLSKMSIKSFFRLMTRDRKLP